MTAARKLAAILAADVVGYSRMMGEDEAGTAQAVRERREAAEAIAAAQSGRTFKTMGDAVFIEFPSVVSAVDCAIAIQAMMAERNEPVPRRDASSIASASTSATCWSRATTFSEMG
jgi:adenylate cyclase